MYLRSLPTQRGIEVTTLVCERLRIMAKFDKDRYFPSKQRARARIPLFSGLDPHFIVVIFLFFCSFSIERKDNSQVTMIASRAPNPTYIIRVPTMYMQT